MRGGRGCSCPGRLGGNALLRASGVLLKTDAVDREFTAVGSGDKVCVYLIFKVKASAVVAGRLGGDALLRAAGVFDVLRG